MVIENVHTVRSWYFAVLNEVIVQLGQCPIMVMELHRLIFSE